MIFTVDQKELTTTSEARETTGINKYTGKNTTKEKSIKIDKVYTKAKRIGRKSSRNRRVAFINILCLDQNLVVYTHHTLRSSHSISSIILMLETKGKITESIVYAQYQVM